MPYFTLLNCPKVTEVPYTTLLKGPKVTKVPYTTLPKGLKVTKVPYTTLRKCPEGTKVPINLSLSLSPPLSPLSVGMTCTCENVLLNLTTSVNFFANLFLSSTLIPPTYSFQILLYWLFHLICIGSHQRMHENKMTIISWSNYSRPTWWLIQHPVVCHKASPCHGTVWFEFHEDLITSRIHGSRKTVSTTFWQTIVVLALSIINFHTVTVTRTTPPFQIEFCKVDEEFLAERCNDSPLTRL